MPTEPCAQSRNRTCKHSGLNRVALPVGVPGHRQSSPGWTRTTDPLFVRELPSPLGHRTMLRGVSGNCPPVCSVPKSCDVAGPGASPLGMGGASIAVADDSTAMFWNPAGLPGLSEPEICISHQIYNHYNTAFPEQTPSLDTTYLSWEFSRNGSRFW